MAWCPSRSSDWLRFVWCVAASPGRSLLRPPNRVLFEVVTLKNCKDPKITILLILRLFIIREGYEKTVTNRSCHIFTTAFVHFKLREGDIAEIGSRSAASLCRASQQTALLTCWEVVRLVSGKECV